MQHRDRIILEKIVREIDIGRQLFSDVSLDAFLADEMRKRAVAMTVINIGELVKNLSDEIRLSYPDVPWKAVAGMRDLAAHKYQTLRMEDVYFTVKSDFPSLRRLLNSILQENIK